MVVFNILRYKCVIGPVIAGLMCLAGCSRNPDPNVAREAVTAKMDLEEPKHTLSLERVMVPITNVVSTCIGFRRSSPPPWQDGNYLTFFFRKARAPGQEEEWVSWTVVNIHSENFFEITRRLKLDAVEVRVLHATKSQTKIQETGRVERTATWDEGYALVTDARIPRKWLLSEPLFHSKTGWEKLKAAYPEGFGETNQKLLK